MPDWLNFRSQEFACSTVKFYCMSVRICCSVPRVLFSRMLGTLPCKLAMAEPSSSPKGTKELQDPQKGSKQGKRKMASKQYKNHPRKMFKSNYEARFGETDYYFDEGFRRVTPYVYAFETFAKGRWHGHKLLDMFKKEFRLETPEFYAKAIATGLIKVNGERTTADHVVKNNDFLHSRVHRHEPPVTSDPIEIVEQTEEFIVVNKPASIPVHPCGKYRHNTVVFLLAKEHNLIQLHTIHRLDRLTSGLLIFARTKAASQKMDAYVRDRKVKKTYVCKVSGKFPSGTIECNEPIFTVSHKIAVCRVRADGKPCKTVFERISYDGKTSIVKCFPETGRMHQIRVHLQYLGHPIENDPLYNNTVWGPRRGQGGCEALTDDQLLKHLVAQHNEEIVTKINEYIEEKNVAETEQERRDQEREGSVCEGRTPEDRGMNPAMGQAITNTGISLESDVSKTKNGTDSSLDTRTIAARDDLNIHEATAVRTSTLNGGKMSECANVNMQLSGDTGACAGDIILEGKTTDECGTLDNESSLVGSRTTVHRTDMAAITVAKPHDSGSDLVSHASRSNIVSCTPRLSDRMQSKDSGAADTTDDDRLRTANENGAQLFTGSENVKESARSRTENSLIKKIIPQKGLTEMDSTLSGVGVLEVDEARLQELAEEGSEASIDEIAKMLCRECVTPLPDPKPQEMMIYLHALSYKGPDFEFSTPLPKWAVDHHQTDD